MLPRMFWKFISASLFALSCLHAQAQQDINTTTYDIYTGDLNGDGVGGDFYFQQKPLFVLLAGDINVPLFIDGKYSFALYRTGDTYSSPTGFSLAKDQLAAKLAAGQLVVAQLNGDLYYWNNGGANSYFFLRGPDISAPSALISVSANSFPPLLSKNYSASTGLSNRNYALQIKDVNSDGYRDLVLGSYVSSTGETAFLADANGVPSRFFVVTPATTAPTIPSGPVNMVGSTSGQFRVDESGAATYSIPLSFAEGVAGVTPELTVNYSSQAGSGLLGKGWSLGGLSSISRCRQTLSQDGAVQPINWSSRDRFCLNGQRLILSSGVYGATNSIYKTEVDSFVTVTLLDDAGSTYFTVQSKDGSTSTYGRTSDSKVMGLGTNQSTTLTWSINRFEDNVKNAIDYVYDTSAETGQIIRFIRYAYPTPNSAATSASSRSDYQAEIQINSANRTDPSSVFVAGYQFNQTKVVSSIKVLNKGIELRTYNFSYMSLIAADARYQNKITRLETIQECKSTYCLPPLSFTWGGGSHVFFNTVSPSQQVDFTNTSSGKSVLNNFFADVTGDGKTDAVYLMKDKSLATASDPYKADLSVHIKYAYNTAESVISLTGVINYGVIKIASLDYNADGRQDLALYDGLQWKIYLSTPRPDGTWKIDSTSTVIPSGVTESATAFVDVNSDGLADAVSSKTYRLLVRDQLQPISSNKFYKFDASKNFSWPSESAYTGLPVPPSNYTNCNAPTITPSILPTSISDFNGDGVSDFILKVDASYYCDLPNGFRGNVGTNPSYFAATALDSSVGTKSIAVFARLPNQSEENLYPVDLNGDGLTDLAYANTLNNIFYAINTGTGFNAAISWITLPNGTYRAKPQFIDYNGDGRIDIGWGDIGARSFKVLLWGDGETPSTVTSISGTDDSHFLMDLSGDGIVDYLRITSTNLFAYHGVMAVGDTPVPCHNVAIPVSPGYVCVGGNPNPSLPVPATEQNNALISIDNGLGNITKINYGTLGVSGRYTTTDANLSTTQQPSNNPYCSNGTTNMYCPQLSYTVTDSSGFYSRINGGWDLPSGSTTLAAGNTSKGAPVLEVNGSMQIVTSVESSSPTAGATPGNVSQSAMVKVNYSYGEAKMQASGRGFLGFNKLKTVDEQSGVVTLSTYRQDFPFTGNPLSTIVYSDNTATAKVLSKSANTWDLSTFTGPDGTKYFQPKLKTTVDESYDLASGGLLQTTTTNNESDSFGNATKITAVTSGKKIDGSTTTLTKVTANTYGAAGVADYNNIYGRLLQTTVTTTRDTEPSLVRTSSFSYYGDGDGNGAKGLLKSETVEPGNAAGLTKVYTYDKFGNKNQVQTTAINYAGVSETRTTASTYSSDGRDLVSTINDLQQTAQINSRNEFGQPTRATDINSLSSEVFYDGMGREYMSKQPSGAWTRTETRFCGGGVTCPTGAKYRTDKTAAGGSFAVEYFDMLGRSIRASKQSFDGRLVHVDTEYDALGRVKRQSLPYFDGSSPAGWTENTYDILGRTTKTTSPDGTFSTVEYAGYDTTTINSLGQKRKETRNGLGQLVRVTDNQAATPGQPAGTIDYEYDLFGNLLKATTTHAGASISVRMCYDGLGRKTAMFDLDKGGFKGNGNLTCAQVAAAKQPGWWYYTYNGFGELVSQTDTKNQRVQMAYDKLGRMIGRTDYLASGAIEGFSQWFFEKDVNGASTSINGTLTAVVMNTDPALTQAQVNDAINNARASCSELNAKCHKTRYGFDVFSRPRDTTVFYPGSATPYTSWVEYDTFGRATRQYDALDRKLSNGGAVLNSGVMTSYNDYGYATKITDIGSGELIQQTLAVNERGQVTSEYRGNGVTSSNTYNNLTGQLTDQQSGMGALFSVQNIHYKWDSIGNLKYRDNQSPFKSGGGGTKNLKESFCYDALNRLTKTVAGIASAAPDCSGAPDVTYDGFGNIKTKVGLGTYTYGVGAGPHAVTNTTTDGSYGYDDNGNQISGAGRNLAYTSYDMLSSVTKNGASTSFSYGPDRARWQRIDVKNSITTVTTYMGNVERVEQLLSGYVEWRRNVGGAIYTYRTNTNNQIQANGVSKSFVYSDHLGSVDVITNAVGVIQQSLSFDPWGARRGGENWGAFAASELNLTGFVQPVTTRGFTGHEMVDDMGLIHMNGRVYDARLGRFLQADPHIDGVKDTQGYNRYSYVHNNPLNATDPSGYFSFNIKNIVKLGLVIALSAATYGAASGYLATTALTCTANGAMLATALSGAAAGFVTGATMATLNGARGKDVLNAGLKGASTGFANTYMSAGAGFVSGKIGVSASSSFERVIAKAVVGGTVSVITGRKFINGAGDAIFQHAVVSAASMISAGGSGSESGDYTSDPDDACTMLGNRCTWNGADDVDDLVLTLDGSLRRDIEVVEQGLTAVELASGVGGAVKSGGVAFAKSLPNQIHHFATNKSKFFTPRMKKIANKFGLDLDGAWNKELLAHQGRHPNMYHDFVERGMQKAAREAGKNKDKFLNLFEKYVKEPVRQNPDLLRKIGWQ